MFSKGCHRWKIEAKNEVMWEEEIRNRVSNQDCHLIFALVIVWILYICILLLSRDVYRRFYYWCLREAHSEKGVRTASTSQAFHVRAAISFSWLCKAKTKRCNLSLAGTGSSQHCVYFHNPISGILIPHYGTLKKKNKTHLFIHFSQMVLSCVEAHLSILERRTRLKRKNRNKKLWGAQVYLCSQETSK